MSAELKQKLIEHFAEGNGFDNIRQARSFAKDVTGEHYNPGTPNAKNLEETIEESVVAVSRNIVKEKDNPLSTYDRLLDLYERQPILGTRTSSSVERQAYSTPVPIAYLASKIAGIDENKTVYEPTAGNGALLIAANPQNTAVNELDPKRASSLREAGFTPHVGDATQFKPEGKFDVVIENPPFGGVKDDEKQTLSWDVGRYKTKEIDHAIALKSLESLKDDGTAVLIIAGTKGTDPEEISNHYNSGQGAPFFKTLYDNYNVTQHLSVDGGLYNRQGAGYPIDIIKIEGRGKSEKPLPAVDIPPKYHSFAELKEVLKNAVLDANPRTNQRGEISEHSLVLDNSGTAEQYNLHKERASSPRITSSEGREADGAGDSVRSDRQSVQRDGVVGVERPVGEFGEATTGTARSRQSSYDPNALGRGSDDRASDDQVAPTSRIESDVSSISSDRGDGKRSGGIDSRDRTVRMDQLPNGTTHSSPGHNGLDSDLQAIYEPFSQGKRMGGLVPVNMRSTVHKVLGDLVNRVTQEEGIESIDDWVIKKLNEKVPNAKLESGIWDQERLFDALSAEQIDSVALGIHNFDKNREFIIGDETGFGKTRQLAALTMYGMQQGFTPVYVTKDQNLYQDVLGGFEEIGVEGVKPYGTNTPKKKQKQHKQETEQILASGSLGDKNMVLTTYSQMQTIKGKETDRRNLLRQITAEDGLLIMDECHLAGGSQSNITDPGKAPNGAEFARELKQNAGRTISASATFAKNPEVMDLYSRTSMSKAVDNVNDLIEIVNQGGRGLQEILSNQLTEAGEYLRRERPFQAEFSTVTLEVDKSLCNAEAEVMEAIVQFDQAKNSVVRGISEDLKSEAKKVSRDNSIGMPSVDSTNFTSLMHNYLGVSNLSKKIDAAVDFAVDAIERGEKPVVGVARTVESFIKDYANEMDIQPGSEIDASFKDMLAHYAEKSREITVKDAFGEKSRHRLTDEELGPFGVAAWENIQKSILNLDTSSNPISPIDMFKTKMEERGYIVGEITGRGSGIDYVKQEDNSYKAYYKTFPLLSEAPQKRATTNGFNNGDIDCLIGNRTMSTGISLHASEKFADQRQRHFLLLQPEGDINIAKQFFGRFDRTGQVNAPKITIGAADIPYERRVQSNLMGKLSSLSANTTANRESQVDFGETRDFLNKYGDEIAAGVLAENPELDYKLNYPSSDGSKEGELIKKLTGRLPILSIDEQEKVMNQIETGYDSLMKELDALGTNELKNSTLDLDAVTLASVEVVPAKDEEKNSSFLSPVTMDILNVKSGEKPYTSREVVNLVRRELGLDSLDTKTEIPPDMLTDSDIDKASTFKAITEVDKIESTQVDYQESRRGLFKTKNSVDNFIQTTNKQAEINKGIQRAFPVGTPLQIETPSGDTLYGVVLNHRTKQNDTKSNPLRPSNNSINIAITGGAKELELPLSKIGSSDDKYSLIPQYYEVTQNDKEQSILELFDNNQADREQRYMLTGNLLNAASKFRDDGKIVHYTDSHGERHPGFLLNKDFEPKNLENIPIKLSKVEQVESFTKEQERILHTRDERLKFSYSNSKDQYLISVPKSKKDGGEFFLDKKLLEAATNSNSSEINEFFSKGDRSVLHFDDSQLVEVVEHLNNKWGLFATGEDIVVAKKMLGLETTNFDELLNTAIVNQHKLQEETSISELNIDVDNNESSIDNFPLDTHPTIDTPGKKAINQITGDVELTLAVDSAIHSTRKDDWVKNRFKEREVSAAIKKVVGEGVARFEILEIIKNYPEYTQQSIDSNLETEEVVNNEPLTKVLSTEEEVNNRLMKSNDEDFFAPKQLTLFEYETTSLSVDNTQEKSSDNLSIIEEISQMDIQQQRVEYVASVTEDLLKYAGTNYYEGSEHTAFKDSGTNTLTITTADKTPVMTAGFNIDNDKWENIESNLSEKDVSHFQKVQAIVTQRIEDKHDRIQQQKFVDRLAPLIADYHDLTSENSEFGGYSTEWDSGNKILTLTDNTEEKEILAAKLNSDGWENINSKLSNWQVDELENHLMSQLDINTEELQAKRFEVVQPIVADILRNFRTNVFEGQHYSAQWDKDSMTLSAWSHSERQAFLSAHWDQNSGWQDLSENPISFQIAHHLAEDVQPALEKYRERTTPDLER